MRPQIARSAQRESERGFALLLVFLLAAGIALMLYQQVPRVAFESERDKEQLLIDRGEQYKRAIQQFYVAYKRYPTTLEELEKTNDKRYLRHRYIDPYTGKDEWRLIHVNAAGQLTDSLVKKLPDPNKPNDPNNPNGQSGANGASNPGTPGSNTAGSSGSAMGSLASNLTAGGGNSGGFPGNGGFPPGNSAFPPITTTGGAPGAPGPNDVNAAVLRRPSDRPLTSGQFATAPTSIPVDPNNPNGAQYNSQPGSNQLGTNPADPNNLGLQQNGPGGPGQPGFPQSTDPLNPNSAPNPAPFNNNPAPFNNNTGANTTSPTLDFPPISLQALQQQQGSAAALNNGVPGQAPANPAGNQVRLGQNGQFIPITPNQANANQFGAGQAGTQSFPGAQQAPAAQPFPSGTPSQFGDPNAASGAAQAAVPSAAGTQGPGSSNGALGLINQILTTPRQPPAAASTSSSSNVTSGGLGLAGVASTYDGPTVKVYKDRKKFKEWEFIFDMQSLTPQPPGTTAATGTNTGTGQNPSGGGPLGGGTLGGGTLGGGTGSSGSSSTSPSIQQPGTPASSATIGP